MDKLNPFRTNHRHLVPASRARDPNTAKAEPARSVFSETKMVEVSGQSLRVGIRRAKSSSPPLVVFNGIGANLELLEPFVKALKGIEVVAFDVPGIGGSPAPALPYRYSRLVQLTDYLLAELGYDGQVDVLGLSWGGMLAQQYAYANPRRCRRLILAATSSGSIMLPGRLSTGSRLINPRRYVDPAYCKRRPLQICSGSLRRRPGLIDSNAGTVRPPRGLGYFYQLAALWGWTSLPWLYRLRQPTLVMAGTDDQIVPLANAEMLAYLIRHARLFTINDGHLFLITRANEVAPVIMRFLAEPMIENGKLLLRRRGIGARLRRLAQAAARMAAGRSAKEGALNLIGWVIALLKPSPVLGLLRGSEATLPHGSPRAAAEFFAAKYPSLRDDTVANESVTFLPSLVGAWVHLGRDAASPTHRY